MSSGGRGSRRIDWALLDRPASAVAERVRLDWAIGVPLIVRPCVPGRQPWVPLRAPGAVPPEEVDPRGAQRSAALGRMRAGGGGRTW